MLVAAALLEAAVFCVHRIEHARLGPVGPQESEQTIGGGALAAIPALARSPYLMGVGLWVALLSYAATIVYFEQAQLVSASVGSAGQQTRIFASIDLAVSVLTLATQILITGEVLKRLGTGLSAAALPAVYIVGFAFLGFAPSLIVVVIVQVLQRWMNFAIANPARQLYFTVVSREDKYKAKNLIDVVIYRGADALSGWIFDTLQVLGLKLGAIALYSIPVVAGWFVLSLALGRTQEKRSAELGESHSVVEA